MAGTVAPRQADLTLPSLAVAIAEVPQTNLSHPPATVAPTGTETLYSVIFTNPS
jgi:hypothetical protein